MDIKIDPIEKTDEYVKIKDEVEKEMEIYIKENNLKGKMGACHYIWDFKKKLLREKYNIDWHSPKELNPEVIFD